MAAVFVCRRLSKQERAFRDGGGTVADAVVGWHALADRFEECSQMRSAQAWRLRAWTAEALGRVLLSPNLDVAAPSRQAAIYGPRNASHCAAHGYDDPGGQYPCRFELVGYRAGAGRFLRVGVRDLAHLARPAGLSYSPAFGDDWRRREERHFWAESLVMPSTRRTEVSYVLARARDLADATLLWRLADGFRGDTTFAIDDLRRWLESAGFIMSPSSWGDALLVGHPESRRRDYYDQPARSCAATGRPLVLAWTESAGGPGPGGTALCMDSRRLPRTDNPYRFLPFLHYRLGVRPLID